MIKIYQLICDNKKTKLMKQKIICLLILISSISVFADQIIIPTGSNWKYLDNGSNLGNTWKNNTFNDASWASGNAELGYGDGNETTVVNGGPSSNRFITTYFRKIISVSNASLFSGYSLRVKRDDGIVIYANGIEVYRDNMPNGTPTYTTFASSNAIDDGSSFRTATIASSAFVTGNNTIAVEIHQRSRTSSDISFDLELTGIDTVNPNKNEVIYQWSGALTATSATVVAKMTNPSTTCKLVVSTSSSLISPVFSADATASTANNRMAKMNITGLVPNTTYYYAIQSNGVIDNSSDDIGKFKTPVNGAFSYKFTVGSCAVSSNHQVYTIMNSKTPLFHLSTGDINYDNPNSATNINVHRLPYEQNMLSQTPTRNFFINTPLAHVWDDHDYCGDNSTGSSSGRTNARLAYQEYVPHYPLASGAGNVPIYQSFTIGRVHFILSDLRSERFGSSIMGNAQKTWFKNQCLFARNNNLMIAWVSGVSFGGNRSDNWGGFVAERTELSNFFRDNNIKNMFILSGDAHMLAIDNGSNHDFSTGTNNPNDYPVFQAAAINNVGSTKGGTYSEGGTFPNSGFSTGQYGVVEVTDSGTTNITIKFTGFRTNGNTTTESVLTNYTFTRTLSATQANKESMANLSLRTMNEGQKIQLSWDTPSYKDQELSIERGKEENTTSAITVFKNVKDHYIDENPESGWNYYSIKNAEGDVIVKNKIFIGGKTTLTLAPNPAINSVNIILKDVVESSDSRYIVYNSKMRTALQGTIHLDKGATLFPLDISGLEVGVYIVRVVINGIELEQKLMKN
jgi:phosphodiesterase/alkaline phosphatase D-like protein